MPRLGFGPTTKKEEAELHNSMVCMTYILIFEGL